VFKVCAKVKRSLWVAGINIVLVLTVGSVQAFATTPIPIANQDELESIGTALPLNGEYILTESFSVTSTGSDTYVDGEFIGTIDGDGYTVSGLNKPLFDLLWIGSLVKNLNLEADTVTGRGMLANRAHGTIDNVHVTGNVIDTGTPDGTGGLVGTSEASISNSSATGDVTGEDDVGGLVGSSSGSISSSWYLGDVNGQGSIGGLVGSSTGNISGSYAGGSVSGVNSHTGGLVGLSQGAISNSYASGDVTGFNLVGGLVGLSYSAIENSYATGTVTGNDDAVGGLVGYNDGDISNSDATGSVNGDDFVGGLVGENSGDISNSYAAGTVTGDDYTGGLVGENGGDISNSYSMGAVVGDYYTGGLVGWNDAGDISNSYATGTVNGDDSDDGQNFFVGGLVGIKNSGNISNSYATGTVNGDDYVGGLVGSNIAGNVLNSYAMGAVVGDYYTGGLVGEIVIGTIDEDSYSSGEVNGEPSNVSPLAPTELLNILNTGSALESPTFALASNRNSGRPYLISNPPSIDFSPNFSDISCVPSKALDALRKPVGFKTSKSDLGKSDIALLDQVMSDSKVQIIGAKLFASGGMCSTALSVGRLLQLEVTFEPSKSIQVWVKSSNNQYVLMGDITFDKDGNAVLPGIDFKKSGQYEFIFVNSVKKDSTQPDLINKVGGVTVYVYK